MAENMHSINLLPNKGHGLTDQFLSWALTIGRLLIILTETLALSVFLYRFSIDMKIVDLNDVIKNQSAIVQQFRTVEATSRNLQERIALANQQINEESSTASIFSDVIDMGRGGITFKSVVVSDSLVKIQIQTRRGSDLNEFINKLRTYHAVESVSIDSVENKISSALIIANITAQLKGAKTTNDEIQAIHSLPGTGEINP